MAKLSAGVIFSYIGKWNVRTCVSNFSIAKIRLYRSFVRFINICWLIWLTDSQIGYKSLKVLYDAVKPLK